MLVDPAAFCPAGFVLVVFVAFCPTGFVPLVLVAFCPAGFVPLALAALRRAEVVLPAPVAFCTAWPVSVAAARDAPLLGVAALGVPALDLSVPDLAAPGAAPLEAVSPAAFAGETFTNRMSGRSPGAASSVTGLRMAQARMAWASGR